MLLTDLLRWAPCYVIQITGQSMSPTLRDTQRQLVLNLPFLPYHQNDLVVCRDPRTGKLLSKRISRVLPDGSFFVTGDNASHSTDSRTFGAIPRTHIYGKILL